MRWKLLALALLLSSGCIVNDPDEFRIGGEFQFETSGILQYVTGLKIRVFGGIMIIRERRSHESRGLQTELPIDALSAAQ